MEEHTHDNNNIIHNSENAIVESSEPVVSESSEPVVSESSEPVVSVSSEPVVSENKVNVNHEVKEKLSCDDASSGKYVSIGNYLSRPMAGETLKIATLPLPKLEFHNGCKAHLSHSEYMVPLRNDIEIVSDVVSNPPKRDILYVRIVLYLRFAEHDFISDDFKPVEMSLFACHDGGVHRFIASDNEGTAKTDHPTMIVTPDRCATITLSQYFIIDGNDKQLEAEYTDTGNVKKLFLRCVNALKYQLCLESGIRVKRKPCSHKLIKDCVPYSYTGDAYVSLTVPK